MVRGVVGHGHRWPDDVERSQSNFQRCKSLHQTGSRSPLHPPTPSVGRHCCDAPATSRWAFLTSPRLSILRLSRALKITLMEPMRDGGGTMRNRGPLRRKRREKGWSVVHLRKNQPLDVLFSRGTTPLCFWTLHTPQLILSHWICKADPDSNHTKPKIYFERDFVSTWNRAFPAFYNNQMDRYDGNEYEKTTVAM